MDNIVTSGQILSLKDLLEKYRVEIPIIQRDYAQGRVENGRILKDFLEALKKSIDEGKEIKLDFVYGEIVGVGDNVAFLPLDGQQRLTTLFLLHWYAIAKKDDIPEDIKKNIKKILLKFTYETRISSREFCHDLIEKSIKIGGVGGRALSEQIIDAPWFYLSWKQDPTISAMLNTINHIHEIFKGIGDLWKQLTEKKLIKFHFLDLHDLGLSDDLYIKMNARGKPLTPFENFKALFLQRIEKRKWEEGYLLDDKFDVKIDNRWTDIFWNKYPDGVDEAHIRFIATITMSIIAANEKDKAKLELISGTKSDENRNDENKIDERSLLECIDSRIYDGIYKCYDIFWGLTHINKNIDLDLTTPIVDVTGTVGTVNDESATINCWELIGKEPLLDCIAFGSSSYTQKALLYAQIKYLMKNTNLERKSESYLTLSFDRESYLNWMKVIRNILCDSTLEPFGKKRNLPVRNVPTFIDMITLINTLAEGCNDIYGFLSTSDEKKFAFRSGQMKEEIQKAKMIARAPELSKIIWKLENLELFKGKISFVFECCSKWILPDDSVSGEEKLKKFYEAFNSESVDDDFKKRMLTNLEEFYAVFDKYFTRESFDENPNRNSNIDFNRAMLTIRVDGEYKFYDYWSGGWTGAGAYATRYKFISELDGLEYYISYFRSMYSMVPPYTSIRKYYKEYFLSLVLSLLKKDYNDIINDFICPSDMPNWKKRLIKEGTIMKKHKKSDFFAVTNSNTTCYLLKSKQPQTTEDSYEVD